MNKTTLPVSFVSVLVLVVGLFCAPVVNVAAADLGAGQMPPFPVGLRDDSGVKAALHMGEANAEVDGAGGLTPAEIDSLRELARETVDDAHPHSSVVEGQMWSDRIGIPEGVDKRVADEAEVAIAHQQVEESMAVRSVTLASGCVRYPWTAFDVCGAIRGEYDRLGGLTSWLLDPQEPEMRNPDGVGFHQRFRNGFIYWHPDTGAFAVQPDVAAAWQRNGWEAGYLGYPTASEVPVSGTTAVDGTVGGWMQQFQGGRIYRMGGVNWRISAAITGEILQRWLAIGGPDSDLGFPVSDEQATKDGAGRWSGFEDGVLTWHPSFGAFEVTGVTYIYWQKHGGTDSRWGYPVGPASRVDQVPEIQRFSKKDFDVVQESADAGTVTVKGQVVSRFFWEVISAMSSRYGINVDAMFAPEVSLLRLDTRQATPPALPHPATPFDGGVHIPQNYIFWGYLAGYRYKEIGGRLHDFCTNSPESVIFDSPSKVFQLHGSCARHDMCYEKLAGKNKNDEAVKQEYRNCDSSFIFNNASVCKKTHPISGQCYLISIAYYSAVRRAHPENYQ
ncbi:LGFP repeat-containing protein [Corynebacterium pyruviciproducens]|nr:LGFP repeat-containing protein [Corynebacterium pyruviciproducens]